MQNKNYKGIVDLKNSPNINAFHLGLIAEGEIISLNNLKKFDQSFYIASDQYKNCQPIAMPVFLYRMIELIPKAKLKKYNLVDTMIHYIERKLKTNNYTLYDLMFMYEVYKYIFFHLEEFKDLELILSFSNAFLKVNDEPGRIDSLRLASLLDIKYKKYLNELIKNSHYYFINSKNSDALTNNLNYKLMLQKLESFSFYSSLNL